MGKRNPLKKSPLRVGIICPCPPEYETCCRILDLGNASELARRAVASKVTNESYVLALKAGLGKIRCASATQLIIDRFSPDYILDVGAAGALSDELMLFDIVCAKNAFEYDLYAIGEFSRWASDLTASTGLANSSSPESSLIIEFADWVAARMSTRLVVGDIASGEKDIAGGELRRDLHEKLGAIACNWETSAVLKTAQLNLIPAFSFRIITDMAGENMKEQFNNNWEKALQVLYFVLKEFIFGGWLHQLSR